MTLSQFCLACTESRWVWFGLRPWPRAQDAGFSVTRVLALTAGHTSVGLVLGGLLSLLLALLFQGPMGWLVWLFVSFAACQGLIFCALMALSWNQRAARLRASPGLDPRLPSTRYPIFRWLLGFVYFVVLGMVTPAAVSLTIENVRGEVLWRQVRARLSASGERLAFRDLLGPQISAEQNAGAAPIFAPFFDYTYQLAQGEVWRDTNLVQRTEERLGFPDRLFPKRDQHALNTPAVNLAAWANAYRELTGAPTKQDPAWAAELKLGPATNSPARDVLAGVSVADAELTAICAASTRPRSQFPVHYEETSDALLRHLSLLKSASRKLELRCAAELELGQDEAAFQDAQCALRVAELIREEPLLISQLVRYAQGGIAARTVWQGLATHRWTDPQLAALQAQCASIDYLPGLVLAFEGERASCMLMMDSWVAAPSLMSAVIGTDQPVVLTRFPATLFARGLLRENQVALARYQSQMIAALRGAISNAPQAGLILAAKSACDPPAVRALSESRSPFDILAKLLSPATDNAIHRTARAQTTAQMAAIACALERYRLAHGAYPQKLDDLVPALLPTPPMDPMNSQPYHYLRTDDGWFQLYSVGLDGHDDGGVFKLKEAKQEKDWPWPVPTRPAQSLLF